MEEKEQQQETKSRFSPLYLTPTQEFKSGRRLYRLTRDFTYDSPKHGYIRVPRGFLTDGASVPRLFTPLVPTDHLHLEAAVIHDYMLENGILTKKEADEVFDEGLKYLGVKTWRRVLMVFFVRIFGKGNY